MGRRTIGRSFAGLLGVLSLTLALAAALLWLLPADPAQAQAQPYNHVPQFASDTATGSVAENAPAGQSVGDPITANDPDEDAPTHSLAGPDNDSKNAAATVADGRGPGKTDEQVTDYPVAQPQSEPQVAGAPAKPVNFTVIGGNTQATLSWSHPGDDTITGWQYNQDNAATWTNISSSDKDTTTHKVGSLSNNTEYSFKLRAVNANGNGAESDVRTAWPSDRSLSISPATMSEADFAGGETRELTLTLTGIKFAGKGDGGRRRDGRNFDARTGLAGGKALEAFSLVGAPDGLAITQVRRLSGGNGRGGSTRAAATLRFAGDIASDVVFSLRISRDALAEGNQGAVCGDTTEPESTCPPISATVTMMPAVMPTRPAEFTATGGHERVILQWMNPNDDTVTRWQYRQKAGNGEYGEWTNIPSSDRDTTAHTVTRLVNGSEYSFQIRAVNAQGEGPASAEAVATAVEDTTGPTIPAVPAIIGDPQTYYLDDVIRVAVTFSEPIILTGEPQLTIKIGDAGKTAACATHRIDATRLVCSYRVAAADAGGIEIEANQLALNGGTIKDDAGNDANPNHPVLPAQSDRAVDTSSGLARPVNFTATGGDAQVTLAWSNPGNATITKWQYNQNRASTWTAIPGSDQDTTTYTVTGLNNYRSYSFKLRAVSDLGNGPASAEISAWTSERSLAISPATVSESAFEAGETKDVTLTLTGIKFAGSGKGGRAVDGRHFDEATRLAGAKALAAFSLVGAPDGLEITQVKRLKGGGDSGSGDGSGGGARAAMTLRFTGDIDADIVFSVRIARDAMAGDATGGCDSSGGDDNESDCPPVSATMTMTASDDTIAPTISAGPAFTSAAQTYVTGDAITATVTFSKAVTVTGTPQLGIRIGKNTRPADYTSISANQKTLTFSYTVVSGDADADGIEIEANQLTLPSGATIKDAVGNDATLTHSALTAQSGHKVNVSNTAPEFDAGASVTREVAEDAAEGDNVGNAVTATDADSDTLTYGLSGAGNGHFSIDGSGQITVSAAGAAALDYEATASYSLTASVHDGKAADDSTDTATIDDTITVNITVTNVDEAGTVALGSIWPLLGTALTATLTDPDGGVGTAMWTWTSSTTAGGTFTAARGTATGSALTSSYTPVGADLGKYLRATASVYLCCINNCRS